MTFFLHGYGAVNPVAYAIWIEHIVQRGNALIYPRYQASYYVPTATYTPNAITALKAGIEWLRANAKPKLGLGEGVNVIGHSTAARWRPTSGPDRPPPGCRGQRRC